MGQRLFDGNRGVWLLGVFSVLWTILSVGILQIDETAFVPRVIYTLLCGLPLALSSWVFYQYHMRIIFNADKADDHKIKVVPLMIVYTIWVLNWALIFLLVWAWDQSAWTALAGQAAYVAWLRLLATTLLVSTGVGFATHVASSIACQLIAGIMAFVSIAIAYTVLAAGIGVVMDNIGSAPPVSTISSAPITEKYQLHRSNA